MESDSCKLPRAVSAAFKIDGIAWLWMSAGIVREDRNLRSAFYSAIEMLLKGSYLKRYNLSRRSALSHAWD